MIMKEKIGRKIGYHEAALSKLQRINESFGPKASLSEIRNAAARICGDYLTGRWKEVCADELIVKRISGGLSNFLYYVALPDLDDEDRKKSVIGNAVDKHSTAINIDQENYEEIDVISGAGATRSTKKRRRTDSGGCGENFASLAFRRYSQMNSHGNEPEQVLLRIYGQSHGEDALEAMITESVVFALLSERNFGPKLHGIFPGGRIEQYVPARALTTTELSDERISKKIAEKMGEIHSLNIPMSKEPDWIWNCMERWLTSVNNILRNDNIFRHREHSKTVFTFDFAAEGVWLKSLIDNGNYPVVFCHNDLQEGNILFMDQDKSFSTFKLRDNILSMTNETDTAMEDSSCGFDESLKRKRSQLNNSNDNNNAISHIENDIDNTRDSAFSITSSSFATADDDWDQDKEPNLMIIDFEYCAYNYRGFDLANHFLEWTFDYTNPQSPFYYHFKQQYPTEKQKYMFISSYLCKLNSSVADYEPTSEEIERIQYELRVFSMLSHLFWSLWSIVNLSSNIEFGYWEYAVSRINEYRKFKQAFINADTINTRNHSISKMAE